MSEANAQRVAMTLKEFAGLSALQCEALNLSGDIGCACGEPGCVGVVAYFGARFHVVHGVFQRINLQSRIVRAVGSLPPQNGGRA